MKKGGQDGNILYVDGTLTPPAKASLQTMSTLSGNFLIMQDNATQ